MSMKTKKHHWICGVSATALLFSVTPSFSETTLTPVATVTAAAPETTEESAYYIRMLTQIFDGDKEFSQAQNAGFARKRVGQESWVEVDYGDGAVVIERPDKTAVSPFQNLSGPELGLRYNYDTHMIMGDTPMAAFHNTYARPHLNKGPALGQDAQWQVTLTPAELGFDALKGQAVTIDLSRDYFSHEGRDYVLVSYAIPAFSYDDATGITTVQWGMGVALTDPTFGQMYWNATLHRAVRQEAEGGRPYRLVRTNIAMDKSGKPLINLKAIPQVKALYDQVYDASATEVIGFTKGEEKANQTPIRLSAALDVMALTLVENSANQLGEIAGGTYGGQRGSEGGAQLDAYAALYGIPDKFNAAISGGYSQTALAQLNKDTEYAQNLLVQAEKDAIRLKREFFIMGEELRFAELRFDEIQNDIARKVAAATSPEEVTAILKANKGRVDAQVQAMNRLKPAILKAEKELVGLARLNARLPGVIKRIEDMKKAAPWTQKILGGFDNVLGRMATPLSFLGGLGNMSEVYGTATSLGTFDPANQDLELTGNYSSTGALIGDISLNMLGILGNAASGNVVTTATDVLTFSSGRFTDLYKVIVAAEHAERQSEQAHMEYMVTFKRHINQQNVQWKKLIADLDNISIYKDGPDPYANGYDHTDPRLDPKTGYPKPYWWDLWKRDAPKMLIALGIDPEAPVGGWPNGVGPEHRPVAVAPPPPPVDPNPTKEDWEKFNKDMKDIKPDYPTVPAYTAEDAKRDREKREAEEARLRAEAEKAKNTPIEANDPFKPGPTPPPQPPTVTTPVDPSPLDAVDEMMAHADELTKDDGMIKPYDSDFNTDPVTFDPVTFDPVNFEPVEFEPPVWEPPVWEPPVWVPPTFDPPNPSDIEFTDFDDAHWPGSEDFYEAHKPGNMSGTIATDLSRWEEWLTTQNLREIERLALQAGYPNLASALNDAKNIMALSQDEGYRWWSLQAPSCGGYVGCGPSYAERWNMKRSIVVLGDILVKSRDVFSTAGLTDIGISGFNLSYIMRDYSLEDGDIVDVTITQFGRTLFYQRVNLLNAGTEFNINLMPGVASVEIYAVNEGYSSPNTAAIKIDEVVEGEGDQTYSLSTGETATLRVEANAGKQQK